MKQQPELISKQCQEGQTIVKDKYQRFVIVYAKCFYVGHLAKNCPYNTQLKKVGMAGMPVL